MVLDQLQFTHRKFQIKREEDRKNSIFDKKQPEKDPLLFLH